MTDNIHSSEGEVWILSGLLAGGTSYVDETITNLSEDHFYERSHKIIFKAISETYESGSPVDAIIVSQKLKDQGKLEEIGGHFTVHKLSLSSPTRAHSEYWINLLDQKRLLRQALELFSVAEREIKETENVDQYISDLESKILNLRKVKNSDNLLVPGVDSALVRNEKLLSGIKVLGIETGIKPIDSIIGGLCESRLIYICARGGKGKTALIEQMFENIIKQGKPILVFQRDMPIEMMIERMACRNAGVNYFSYSMGHGTRESQLKVKLELEGLKEVKDLLHIQSPFRLTAQDLLSIVRREKKKHGIEAVFLDHIQNIDIGDDEMRQGLTKASSTIRRSAQDSNLPHVIIAQLNRDGSEGRPKATHVKEFDSAYADCDSMVMLWSEKTQAELDVGEMMTVKFTYVKNRYGPEAEEEMLFDGNLLKFKEKRKL